MGKRIFIFYLLLVLQATLRAQEPLIRGMSNRMQQMGGSFRQGGGTQDSLRQRNKQEDSITIHYRYLDSVGTYLLDSSVRDFTRRYPLPATWINLGNTGTAARSLLFAPAMQAGFRNGFNAFDVYNWNMETVRFFQTTRPYSEINYLLGSRVEQIIELLHTQNLKPNWNAAFGYRMINSPGFFKNQKVNHNNYQFTSSYEAVNRRYRNQLVLLGNKLQAGENGGLQDDANYLDDPIYKDRFNIQTKLGGDNPFSSNFFSTTINTGNKYNTFSFLLRQQYDLGRKDSLVTDSTVIPLFYPRVRFEHTLRLDQNKFIFQDFRADSVYYKTVYDTTLRRRQDTFLLRESWKVLHNDFAVIFYPDAQNLKQFFKTGLLLQQIVGELSSGRTRFVNTAGHAEYRNKTRNQRWDLTAYGKLYFTGFNQGDYEARVRLLGFTGKKTGYLELGFENVNRSPAFLFDSRSSFYLDRQVLSLNKENITQLYAGASLPRLRLDVRGRYFLVSNFTYFDGYFRPRQASALFTVFVAELKKSFRIGRRWNWHAELYFQQNLGDAPLNLPVIYSRNRIAYEGNLGFRNLDIAFGAELRYRPPYMADGYSPVLGQFFYQDQVTIRNSLPDISGYVHFRIRPLKFFIRAENLNTARNLDGFGFTRNNLVSEGYALPGLQIRTGVYWGFVN